MSKHPTKVHVWAGISKRGCIRWNDEKRAVSILEGILLPFVKDVYPDGQKLMQDNDPKHTSLYAKKWIDENGANSPAESPDLRKLWHELQE